MEKVFLTEHIHPDAVAYLRENFEVVQGTSTESGEIIRQAQGCSAILIRSAKITAEIMDAIPTLKVVAKHGMGVDNIAVDHATEKGILVVNAPYSNLNAVAEHIVMLLLALSKRTVQMDQLTRAGQFKERNTYKTIELKGATVGIIGMGKISRLVVKKLSGFEMNILATDPYVKQADVEGLGITMATPEELYAKSDFVLYLPSGGCGAVQGYEEHRLHHQRRPGCRDRRGRHDRGPEVRRDRRGRPGCV